MKNMCKARALMVNLALCGMTFGLIFPPDTLQRVLAEENQIISPSPGTPVKPAIIEPSREQVNKQLSMMSVEFEENRGQFDRRVRYAARVGSSTILLTAAEAVYVLPMESPRSKVQSPRSEDFRADDLDQKPTKMFALRMTLIGANADSTFAGEQISEHRTNYFRGSDEVNWQTDIPNFGRVRYENVYDDVGMVWHGKQNGETQYDFVVAPNADAGQISLEFDGADNLEIDADGNLLIHTPAGVIKHNKPFSYQESDGISQEVSSGFVIRNPQFAIRNQSVGFVVGEYDRSKPLTIDPTVNLSNLTFSTFLGGTGQDRGNSIAVDNAGNSYVVGTTFSASFPTTAGAFDTTYNDDGARGDVFVTKLNSNGSALVYSTFIGGMSTERGHGIAIDASGNAFITGDALSGDYPTTPGAFDTVNNNGNIFVTKLNSTGSALIYSTFLGGSILENGFDIALDASGNALVTGVTQSFDFPATPGSFDTTYNDEFNGEDGFVAKLNSTGSSLVYATYLGGDGEDEPYGIAVDASGNAYLTGWTINHVTTQFPTTAGAFDTTFNGGGDVFVIKLNSNGSALDYSTFLGGSGQDVGRGIVVDSFGNAIVTGLTGSPLFPTTPGSFDQTLNGSDSFVTKLNSTGSSLVYSTFLGGFSSEYGYAITLDSSGNAVVTGSTRSPDFPTTVGAFDESWNGGDDVFVTKLNSSGTALSSSTYVGGIENDVGYGIALDSAGNVFITGETMFTNFTPIYPTTPGAFDTTYNGGSGDAFVSKLTGNPGQTPIADFDGDGKTDIGIFRPAPGEWWYQRSSDGVVPAAQFGAGTDRITPGDFTGDGKTDIAFWRPSTGEWYVLRSEDSSFFSFPFGTTGDVPVPADFDGDGKADATVFRPSTTTWFISRSTGGTDIIGFGAAGDKPTVADYDGDGMADIAIFRPMGATGAEWWIRRSSNASVFATQFGISTDKAVQGDFTGDRKTDIAFWRPSTGFWFVLRSEDFSFFSFPFGTTGDVPSPGDYDGDGRFDAAVFRPSSSTWFVQRSTAGTLIQQFGIAGDIPVPSAFVP